jgi:hypothetical protein
LICLFTLVAMKFLCAILLTSLLSFTQNDKGLIAWSPTYKLQWIDFMGSPTGSLKAMTWSTIKIDDFKAEGKSITLKVSAGFIKNKSWKQKEVDAELLTHEQKHFDITEIYARKLRKKISETKFTSPKQAVQQIEQLSKEVFRESSAYEKKYDAETKHSIIKPEQEKWNKKVEEELQHLNAYSNTQLNLTIK